MSSFTKTPPSSGDARGVTSQRERRTPGTRAVAATARVINPLVARFAGSSVFPLYGLIRHRGRRSGRAYSTPVVARRVRGGFIIPMPFGSEADWFQNIQAAGGCVVRWKGVEYALVAPEVVGWGQARAAFNPLERALAPRLGISRFARLRDAPAASS